MYISWDLAVPEMTACWCSVIVRLLCLYRFTFLYCNTMLFQMQRHTVQSHLKFLPPVISFEGVSQCNRKPLWTLQQCSLTWHVLRQIEDITCNEHSKHSAAEAELFCFLSVSCRLLILHLALFCSWFSLFLPARIVHIFNGKWLLIDRSFKKRKKNAKNTKKS